MSDDELHELIMKTLCLVEMGPGYEGSRFGWRHHADALVAELGTLRADAAIGRKWRADSSLETWFPYTAEELTRLRAELAAALVDAERYRELRRLATTWPTTVLVVNYNIGHTWHTADAPDEIDGVLDDAIAARGHA